MNILQEVFVNGNRYVMVISSGYYETNSDALNLLWQIRVLFLFRNSVRDKERFPGKRFPCYFLPEKTEVASKNPYERMKR